jgi:hypothetical protein
LTEEQQRQISQSSFTRAAKNRFLRKGKLLDEIESVHGRALTSGHDADFSIDIEMLSPFQPFARKGHFGIDQSQIVVQKSTGQ